MIRSVCPKETDTDGVLNDPVPWAMAVKPLRSPTHSPSINITELDSVTSKETRRTKMRATASIILTSIVLAIVGPAMSAAVPSDPLLSKRAPDLGYRVDAYQYEDCTGFILGSHVGPSSSAPQEFLSEANCWSKCTEVPRSPEKSKFSASKGSTTFVLNVFRSHQDGPSNAYTSLFNMSVSPLIVYELQMGWMISMERARIRAEVLDKFLY
ncbi:hypothetical protein DFJ43DRAFT_1157627 [Lentinula guzmanii]|uniref:Uncharacterized protein n=1 Tax=Lentinula guzmanii TaxID=2804957 RepID=A0AA38MXX1_9AGAR|nr:hypothetical protein DFJ43DRAFT_1157627 [Lentinula guzmanii]